MMVLYGFSLDWFKGKSTGNHGFYHQIQGVPVNFPIIQFYGFYGVSKQWFNAVCFMVDDMDYFMTWIVLKHGVFMTRQMSIV